MEISFARHGRRTHRPHASCPLPCHEPRRRDDRHRSGRRDPAILERLPEEGQQLLATRKSLGLWPPHPLDFHRLPCCASAPRCPTPCRAVVLAPHPYPSVPCSIIRYDLSHIHHHHTRHPRMITSSRLAHTLYNNSSLHVRLLYYILMCTIFSLSSHSFGTAPLVVFKTSSRLLFPASLDAVPDMLVSLVSWLCMHHLSPMFFPFLTCLYALEFYRLDYA